MPKDKKEPMLSVQGRRIGLSYPTYFIADIAANHDGNLNKAKELIYLAKESGADAAKFQHFRAHKIVSQYGFETMRKQLSHQSKWKKSVYQIYQEASLPWEWTEELRKTCEKAGIHFFSAPYDLEAIDMLDAHMHAYKIGSGDIDWHEAVRKIALKKKPVFLATGASTMKEVETTVNLILSLNSKLCLMQCNTNYTGNLENFKYINLNVLKTYAEKFPNVVLGLSDHTPGHATVLGSVALGARAIEKHFTSSRKRKGPDHAFSMEPADWKEMVERTRELEYALGDGIKKIEGNEHETSLIQRRSCRAARDLKAGEVLKREDIEPLRPVKPGSLTASQLYSALKRKTRKAIPKGEALEKAFLA